MLVSRKVVYRVLERFDVYRVCPFFLRDLHNQTVKADSWALVPRHVGEVLFPKLIGKGAIFAELFVSALKLPPCPELSVFNLAGLRLVLLYQGDRLLSVASGDLEAQVLDRYRVRSVLFVELVNGFLRMLVETLKGVVIEGLELPGVAEQVTCQRDVVAVKVKVLIELLIVLQSVNVLVALVEQIPKRVFLVRLEIIGVHVKL